jgi:hypothetical protein
MNWLLRLGLALMCIASASASDETPRLAGGTLLFLENCNSVVEFATCGEVGHAALVFQQEGEDFVYEATPGNVRRVSFSDYLTELARINKRRDEDEQVRALALQPRVPYTEDEIARMKAHLDTQLGRRYSVKNYVRGKPYDGIHCAELASTTMNQSGRYTFTNCHTINPQALYTAALTSHSAPRRVTIPSLATQESWCLRAQRRWIALYTWCRWSSREAWLFFW